MAEKVEVRDYQSPVADASVEAVRCRMLPDGRMTQEDSARYLGLKEKTLAMWALQRKGPPFVRVEARVFYFKADLDAFIRGEA